MTLYRAVLAGKDPSTKFTRETATALEGENEAGRFRITRAGARVQGIEGLKPGD
jgi:hypothetical protein